MPSSECLDLPEDRRSTCAPPEEVLRRAYEGVRRELEERAGVEKP